jgi:hypothetical protein
MKPATTPLLQVPGGTGENRLSRCAVGHDSLLETS